MKSNISNDDLSVSAHSISKIDSGSNLKRYT